MIERDEAFMWQAIAEAEAAREDGDVPVGAVIVCDGRIIGRGHNQRERLHDPTAHAEMIALTAASSFLESWRLERCTMFVTLEPCAMCAGALVLARVDRLVYGADDLKTGACGSLFSIPTDERLNHRVAIDKGVLAAECGGLLREFFSAQRALGKK